MVKKKKAGGCVIVEEDIISKTAETQHNELHYLKHGKTVQGESCKMSGFINHPSSVLPSQGPCQSWFWKLRSAAAAKGTGLRSPDGRWRAAKVTERMAASIQFCSSLSCPVRPGCSHKCCVLLRTSGQQRHRSQQCPLLLKQAQSDIHLPGKESKLIAVWLFNRTQVSRSACEESKKSQLKLSLCLWVAPCTLPAMLAHYLAFSQLTFLHQPAPPKI